VLDLLAAVGLGLTPAGDPEPQAATRLSTATSAAVKARAGQWRRDLNIVRICIQDPYETRTQEAVEGTPLSLTAKSM
jgi:hypothetical protein